MDKEGNYFHCDEIGHEKRNYKVYIEDLKNMKGSETLASCMFVKEINLSIYIMVLKSGPNWPVFSIRIGSVGDRFRTTLVPMKRH